MARRHDLREHAGLRLLVPGEDGFVQYGAFVGGLLLRRGRPLHILAAILEI